MRLKWKSRKLLTIFAVEFVGLAEVDLDIGAVELVIAVAALGDTVADGRRWQALVVHRTVEMLRRVADLKKNKSNFNSIFKLNFSS